VVAPLGMTIHGSGGAAKQAESALLVELYSSWFQIDRGSGEYSPLKLDG